MEDVKKSRGEDSLIALVGNKLDLEDQRAVQTSDGMAKAKEHKVLFLETSALDNTGIDDLFTTIVENLVNDEDGSGDEQITPGGLGPDKNPTSEKKAQGKHFQNIGFEFASCSNFRSSHEPNSILLSFISQTF